MSSADDDPYLDYDNARVALHYPRVAKLTGIPQATGRPLEAPYLLSFDYRPRQDLWREWGTCTLLDEEYKLPPLLEPHRDRVVADMRSKGKIRGPDRICARVRSFSERGENKIPHFDLQFAMYSDQAATNLSLKWPLEPPLAVAGIAAHNVREWEALTLGLDGELAPLEESLMANTLGVAVGMAAHTESGERVLLMRQRTKSTPVFSGMWHVPFSFALNLKRDGVIPLDTSLRTVIDWDFGEEHAQEVGVEAESFGPVSPLAFCRELTRGGKPQLFLEVLSKIPFEELQMRTKGVSDEYMGVLQPLRFNEDPPPGASPELVAHMILTRLQYRAA